VPSASALLARHAYEVYMYLLFHLLVVCLSSVSSFTRTTHLEHLEGYMMHSWLLSVRVQHTQRHILHRNLHCLESRTILWAEWRARQIAQRVAERHITATMSLKVHTHIRQGQGGVKTSCQDMFWHLTLATAVVLHSVAYYEVATILSHGSTCSSVSQW
jgi:hypothetical protein